MGVFVVYPHSLWLLVREAGSYDEAGDWQAGSEAYEYVGKCEAVSAGKATEVALPDGTTALYSYTVYMQPDVREMRHGDTIKLVMNGDERVMTVKGFHRYQHQVKLWV